MRAWPCGGVLAFGLLAALPSCTEAPLVLVRISYSGFEPACVMLTVQDSSGGAPRTEPVRTTPGSRQGELLAAVYRQGGWGSELQVSVVAHQQTCSGNIVAEAGGSVPVKPGTTATLPLALSATDADEDGYVVSPPGTDCDDARADVHPGAPEVCNGLDENCASGVDEGFGVGTVCGGDGGCQMLVQCAPDGGTFCASGQAWYPDGDQDGWGRAPEVEFSCTRPDASFVPDGGDCDDAQPRAAPGLTEVCDALDNNCVSGVDEGFGLGGGCATLFGCPGRVSCAPDGGTTCRPNDGGTGLHPDEDGDGAGAVLELCTQDSGVPAVTNADDCDDGDPFSAAGFPEICDRRDNDCDGLVDGSLPDASACPANPSWVPQAAGGGGHAWRSIWSWADGGAWVVGAGGKIRQHLPSDDYDPGTQWAPNYDGDCNGNAEHTAVWADPVGGRAYIVGPVGTYCQHDGGTVHDQTSLVSPTLGDPVSVVGFRNGASLELYVVGRDGGAIRWLPDGGSQALAAADTATRVRLLDVHGVSPDTLFAAGAQLSPPEARLFRFNPAGGDWTVTPVPMPVRGTTTAVQAVHVVSPQLAYAVTDAGHVLRWNGAAWGLHPSPTDAGLRGVLAFGTSSVFVISARSAWEWNGTTWTKMFDAVAATPGLVDLNGTHPGDIWIAQDPEMVFHWPY
jgi:putative metal-binding protein